MILSGGAIKGVVVKDQSIFVVIKTTSNKTEVVKGVGCLLFTLWVNPDHTKPAIHFTSGHYQPATHSVVVKRSKHFCGV